MTEVMSTEDVEIVCEYADVLQVGARNMQNFALLRRLATVDKPVLLKRNPAATSRNGCWQPNTCWRAEIPT